MFLSHSEHAWICCAHALCLMLCCLEYIIAARLPTRDVVRWIICRTWARAGAGHQEWDVAGCLPRWEWLAAADRFRARVNYSNMETTYSAVEAATCIFSINAAVHASSQEMRQPECLASLRKQAMAASPPPPTASTFTATGSSTMRGGLNRMPARISPVAPALLITCCSVTSAGQSK